MEWCEMFGLTVSSAGLLSVITFIFRKWLIARITESIKHEYAKELENHKNDLRRETDTELTRLNGNIVVEVEKAKLKLSFYSEKQFELYNELWVNLCELRKTMNDLWVSASQKNLWKFQHQLLKVDDMLEKKAILIEQHHYDELKAIINEFGNYRLRKESLYELRKEPTSSLGLHDLEIAGLIKHNGSLRQRLLDNLNQMSDCLRKHISGNSDRIDSSGEKNEKGN